MTGTHLAWAAILLPILVVQLWALTSRPPAMLSMTVWDGLRTVWFRVPFFALWAWLTWHWFVEYLWLPHLRGDWVSDALIVAAGAIVGLLAVPPEPDDHDRTEGPS